MAADRQESNSSFSEGYLSEIKRMGLSDFIVNDEYDYINPLAVNNVVKNN